MKIVETEVLVIGGGVTGAGIMRDLALRGIHCLLIDRHDLCAGASGGNHGLLHSGARYVSNDQQAAVECRQESDILKRLAPHCIENTGSLFVAVDGDDPRVARVVVFGDGGAPTRAVVERTRMSDVGPV